MSQNQRWSTDGAFDAFQEQERFPWEIGAHVNAEFQLFSFYFQDFLHALETASLLESSRRLLHQKHINHSEGLLCFITSWISCLKF